MKAAIYKGVKRYAIEERPDPQPGHGEVVMRVEACAVCGTDLRIYKFGQKNVEPGAITGHEISGVIHSVGAGVSGYEPGTRVIVVTSVGCGRCRPCLMGRPNLCSDFKAFGYHFPGGFAQYMLLNAAAVARGNIIPMPDGLGFEAAAIAEPLSCCINGQEYLNINIGDNVAVIGAGPIGCMHLELAQSKGAGAVYLIDINPKRLALVQERGFTPDALVNGAMQDPVEAVMKLTGGRGADVAISACGVHAAQQQAVRMTAYLGRVSLFAGLPKTQPTTELDANLIHYRELSVFGAFASHHVQYYQALSLLAAGKVHSERIVTAAFPLDRIADAFEAVDGGEHLKVVILPWA